MKRTRKILFRNILIAGALGISISSLAGPLDEARAKYQKGDYESAISLLQGIIKKSPSNSEAHYLLGASYQELGRDAAARKQLLTAESKGSADAAALLTQNALDVYDIPEAETHMNHWRNNLGKAAGNAEAELEEIQSRLVMLKNMLSHVEQVKIIDSLQVDADEFFSFYSLSKEAGKLMSKKELRMKGEGVVYIPENKREMLWAETDSAGDVKLMSASILDDGSMEKASQIITNSGNGSDNYPFLMNDGVTLYFANDGDKSLGGYDIFMTRREDGSTLEPVNIGMPFNSTSNDYMMVQDETTGTGWWATDRNAPEGKVTIYMYVLPESRVNWPADAPNIADKALIMSMDSTYPESFDRQAWKEKLIMMTSTAKEADNDETTGKLLMSMGNGRIITDITQLKNSQAAAAAKQLLKARGERLRSEAKLALMRKNFNNESRVGESEILGLEKQIPEMKEQEIKLQNTIINLETGAK